MSPDWTRRLVRAVSRSRAATAPDADDPHLRGRTYAVPFDRVWNEALRLADGGLPRWTLVEQDDVAGVLRAEARTLVWRFTDDVTVRIGLDADAQTRVDVASASRVGSVDLGTNRRRIGRFLRALDASLD